MFLRRFFTKLGWIRDPPRIIRSPVGQGSAEQFIRKEFPDQIRGLRAKGGEQAYLVVMVDGDASGVAARKASLSAACKEKGVPPPAARDNVLICVPTWNIETWLAYLDGDAVNETNKNYRKLPRPRECQPLVEELVDMCHKQTLREPAPASLKDACTNYRRVFGE